MSRFRCARRAGPRKEAGGFGKTLQDLSQGLGLPMGTAPTRVSRPRAREPLSRGTYLDRPGKTGLQWEHARPTQEHRPINTYIVWD